MSSFHFNRVMPLTFDLENHPVYGEVQTIEDLRVFMEHHVFSVWDFMSLAKYLQSHIAPTTVPWMPPSEDVAPLQRAINEIILGEETDTSPLISTPYCSHFELYVGAMEEIGANTTPIRMFLEVIKAHGLAYALQSNVAPEPSKHFMVSTFRFIFTDKPHIVAAAFAFGRERVIPGMFSTLMTNINVSEHEAPLFHYYVSRHIEIDGDLHGNLSLDMVHRLCKEGKVNHAEAVEAACQSVSERIKLWDGVHKAILENRQLNKQTT